jgi:hypothetical protein
VEDVLVREDGVAREAAEEGLEHALPARDHRRVLARLGLLGGVVAERLLARDRRHDQRRVQLAQARPQRLELGVPVPRLGGLCVRSV